MLNILLHFFGIILFKNKRDESTYPGSNLTLPKPALLSDFVGASKLLHVLAEVTHGTVLRPSAGLTFATHSHRTLHLRSITRWTVRAIAAEEMCIVLHPTNTFN